VAATTLWIIRGLDHVFTPNAFAPSAQGCARQRATLGNQDKQIPTLKGLNLWPDQNV